MMFETEGRCPLCRDGKAMTHTISISCDGKSYTFPYRLYHCFWHGYFVWRGKKGHQLADFSKLQHEATRVDPLPPEVPTPTPADYLIVKMKCPFCKGEWKQYDKTWTTQSGGVICPSCGAEIPKEKAVVKRREVKG